MKGDKRASRLVEDRQKIRGVDPLISRPLGLLDFRGLLDRLPERSAFSCFEKSRVTSDGEESGL